MNKLLLIAGASLMMLAACSPKGYTLTGTIENCPDNAKVTLLNQTQNGPITIDSAVVTNGRFTMKGMVDMPLMCNMLIDMQPEVGDEQKDWKNKVLSFNFYMENSPIAIEGDAHTLPTYFYNDSRANTAPKVTGSKTQDESAAFDQYVKVQSNTYSKAYEQYIEEYLQPYFEGEDVTARGIELARELERTGAELQQKTIEFIAANPTSVIGLDQTKYLLANLLAPATEAELTAVVEPVLKAWQTSPQQAEVEKAFRQACKVAQGNPYPDIELVNAEGKTVKLSEYVTPGKYTMLEFWASWCGPCRGEIPHLRHVYEQYKEKGFEMISVSVDENPDQWKKAMSEEKMVWTQLNDPQGLEGIACKDYNILGVPHCIVLDPEGRIFKINMRGAFLDAFLVDTYK